MHEPVSRTSRVRPLRELRARLGAASSALSREGDTLELLWRGQADRVACAGGVQLPFARVGRSDIWELSVRVDRLDEAIVTVVPIPITGERSRFGGPLTEQPLHFRGPRAPTAPREGPNEPLPHQELHGRGIGGPRTVSVWRPPAARGTLPVVYCADNAPLMLARTIAAAHEDGTLPDVMLVGIASASSDGLVDRRSHEYLPGWSRRRFTAHERFILDVVLPWAEREHGAAQGPDQRFALGFSSGARWSLAMAQRHPELFGGAAAFSVAGAQPRRVRHDPGQRYALCAGLLEPGFAANTAAWARLLRRDATTDVTHVERVAGHDPELWREQAAWAIGHLLRHPCNR